MASAISEIEGLFDKKRQSNQDKRKLRQAWNSERRIKKLKVDQETEAAEKLKAEKKQQEQKVPVKKHGTISIAIPVSIIDNCQTFDLKSYVIGEIARSAAIFRVSEIVVFEDRPAKISQDSDTMDRVQHILNYVECPQYLRKALFPFHPFLKNVGLINPLEAPHHLKAHEQSEFREGVVMNLPSKEGTCMANIGLKKECKITNVALKPNSRVTISIESEKAKYFKGEAISPYEPMVKHGKYWGYSVRLAKSFNEVFSDGPFDKNYDLMIGTSDKGKNIFQANFGKPNFEHCIIVFGGLEGLETCLENDTELNGVSDVSKLFTHYVNVCPEQGTRTIRTEEAIIITLSALQGSLFNKR